MALDIEKFIGDQLSVWPEVSARFRELKSVLTRSVGLKGLEIVLQHNPSRISSCTAKVDEDSIKSRACFLCPENEPKEQTRLEFEGRKSRKYNIQINPYPIFPKHLVIASAVHCEQSIWRHFADMLDVAKSCKGFTVFYNGPKAGASAPDHLHYQACPQGLMPLEKSIETRLEILSRQGDVDPHNEIAGSLTYMTRLSDARLYHCQLFSRGIFALRAKTAKSLTKLFYRLMESAPVKPDDKEPRINLFVWFSGGEYRAITIFRNAHHSHHFNETGSEHLTIAPGCADMGGVVIVPVREDFDKLDQQMLSDVFDEVSMSSEDEAELIRRLRRRQPKLDVGIMSADSISFEILSDGAGLQTVSFREGKIDYNGVLYDELFFDAVTRSTLFAEPSFRLCDVTIGVDFHWQRKQDQVFAGSLKFIVEGDKVTAVNHIGVEDYLLSVISSEMKSTAGLEFLKAHAVISRSWVYAQIASRGALARHRQVPSVSEEEIVKWWDHEDHTAYDLCADDHCQRYQGLTGAIGDNVRKAVDSTWGQVLSYDGQICDARFAKCCGGRSELFSTCWSDVDYPYLQSLPDTPGHNPDAVCFCDTDDEQILSQILNEYDLESRDFYRWEQRYRPMQLSQLVLERSGIDFGEITDMQAVKRGPSGRIRSLRIVGSKRTVVIGKELMIRRTLSDSHLKSSAFEVERVDGDFVLRGSGWGHGVGLCQIGAAVMGCKGYSYKQILNHYYPGALIGPVANIL